MKKTILGLLLSMAAVIVLFCGAATIRESYSQKAIIEKIPTLSEMTIAERSTQMNLFDGDIVVRIRLIPNNSVTYAICITYTGTHNTDKKVGDTITVNDFINGGQYLIEN